MREELSSLDLTFLVNELKFLNGGKIQKTFQEGKNIRIEIFLSGKGTFELFYGPGKLFITEFKRKAPEHPEAFASFMRKHLNGEKIIDFRQKDFDRIIEMKTENNIVLFELFSKGNVIVCDNAYMIKMPLEFQLWKDRKVLPKKKYEYPPAVINPYVLTKDTLRKMILMSEKSIVRFLASDLSLSGLYSEEICARTGLDKNKICKTLNDNEILNIFETIHTLVKTIDPMIIVKDGKFYDVVPFDMKIYESFEKKKIQTLNHALDEYFTQKETVVIEEKKNSKFEGVKGKFERIATEQKEATEKWKIEEKENKKRAELIYKNYTAVDKILSTIKNALDQGMSWDQIKEKIKVDKSKEAKKIKEIKENEGKIILDLK